MARKHTIGPWLVCDEWITAGSSTICRMFPNTGNEANDARLIAAAPELANMLREALSWIKDHGHDWETMPEWTRLAESALKKAGIL